MSTTEPLELRIHRRCAALLQELNTPRADPHVAEAPELFEWPKWQLELHHSYMVLQAACKAKGKVLFVVESLAAYRNAPHAEAALRAELAAGVPADIHTVGMRPDQVAPDAEPLMDEAALRDFDRQFEQFFGKPAREARPQ